MKYLIALAAFSSLAFCAPHGSDVANTMLSRSTDGTRQGSFPDFVEGHSTDSVSLVDSTATVKNTVNWAGVGLQAASGEKFNAISATFTVPKPTLPAGAEKGTTYAAAAWVGISGDAILQTGVDFKIEAGSGDISYSSWYEWFPAPPHGFQDFSITAGDEIVLTITLSSPSKGVAKIHNKNTGKTVSETVMAPSSSHTLNGTKVEWIVEDFKSGASLVPFANFDKVVFTNAVADYKSGKTVSAADGTVIDMVFKNGSKKAETTINGSTVTVVYE